MKFGFVAKHRSIWPLPASYPMSAFALERAAVILNRMGIPESVGF